MPQKQTDYGLRQRVRELEEENANLKQLNAVIQGSYEKLRQNNAKHRQMIENLNEVLYILDQHATVKYISPNVSKIGGYLPEEIFGHKFTDFVHPEDLADRLENFQKILEGEDLVTDYRYVTKKGEIVWVRTNARPILQDNKVVGIQGILVDITDHKEAEAALRRSEQKFRNIFDNSVDAILIHSMDGQILEVNNIACQQTGYTRQELLQMRPMKLVAPKQGTVVKKQVQTANQNETLVFETILCRKDGLKYPVEVKIRRIEYEDKPCILCVVRDITERKITGYVLRESEWQKNLILSSSAENIIYFDTDLRIIWANRAAARMVGKNEQELVGWYCYQIYHQQNKPCPDCIVQKAMFTKSPQKKEKKDDDGRFWLQRAYPSTDARGRVNAVVLFTQEITDRKRAEEEKAQLQAQFYQSQKLESIGRLAGGVAHDLNNLLSPILGYGEMLLENNVEKNDLKKSVRHIVEAGKRAQTMARHLLAFSRKQILEFKPLDLNALLKEFEKLLRYTLRENIKIHMVLAESLSPFKGDAGQIEQVLMNLAVNAQDAMPNGGRLFIETAEVEIDETYARRHKGVTPGAYLMLAVSDTGGGMDEEMIENIFEPFFTTKEEDKGTGLGLSTAYGIVKQHGGNIWAYSEPGLGSTFKVYLPVSPDSYEAEEPSLKEVLESDLSGTETIMVAEDEKAVRELVVQILKKQGYNVLAGKNGNDALSKLNHYDSAVHLLITDVVMPDINGKELYEKVVGLYPDIKVIYISGYAEDVITYHGMMDAKMNFLQKPFSVKGLTAKIREVLDQ